MPGLRIEIANDPDSEMHFAQAFTEPGDELVVRSQAIYHSQEEAMKQVRAMLCEAWDRSPGALDPTIGV